MAIGFPEVETTGGIERETLAAELGADRAKPLELKEGLARNCLLHPLSDPRGSAGNLGRAYQVMIDWHARGSVTDRLSVG